VTVTRTLRLTVGRLIIGRTRRTLRTIALDEGVSVEIDEEFGWPSSALFVRLRGGADAVARALRAIEAYVTERAARVA
jgi:hypothetical protein